MKSLMLGARALDVFPRNTCNIPRSGAFKNQLLRNLDANTIERLRLRPINLELRHEIEFPGKPIDHLFFIEEGVYFVVADFMHGYRAFTGASLGKRNEVMLADRISKRA